MDLLLGFLIGLLLSLVICLIGSILSENQPSGKQKKIKKAVKILCISTISLCMFLSANLAINANSRWESEYQVQKNLIEDSIKNENLTGLEKVELVKQANELNASLVSRQYDCQKWYGFLIPDSILEFKTISFNEN